jgi:hypothetical protein
MSDRSTLALPATSIGGAVDRVDRHLKTPTGTGKMLIRSSIEKPLQYVSDDSYRMLKIRICTG